VLAKRLVQQAGPVGQLAVGDDDFDALVTEDPETAPGRMLRGIIGGDHDTADPGATDRVGARRCPALVRARLQRHVHGRLIHRSVPRRADRLHLGMGAAELAVIPLAQDAVRGGDHGANQRVG
jgi:hypothetical protein